MDWRPAEQREEQIVFPEEWTEIADPSVQQQAKKAYGRISWFSFALLLVSQLSAAGLVAVAMLVKPSLAGTFWFLNLASTLPLYLFGLPLCWLMIRNMPRSAPISDCITKKELLHLALICVFLTYACNILGSLLLQLIQTATGAAAVNAVDAMLSGLSVWEILLFMVLLAPFGEELIFRKLVLDRLRSFGEKPAILVSALIFGLFHGNLTQFPYAFVLGLVFGYIYLRTGQLRYTILLHMIVNAVGGLIPVVVLELENSPAYSDTLSTLYAALLIAACIAGLVLLIKKRKEVYFLPMEQEIPRGQQFRATCLNAGMVLMVLAFLVMTATFFIS